MTDAQFAALLARIPIMEEKLDKLLLAFNKIIENNNGVGIEKNEGFPPFSYSEDKAQEDQSKFDDAKMKEEQARELQSQADAIRDELDI